MNREKIMDIVSRFNLPNYRRIQLMTAFYKRRLTSFEDISTLSVDLRSAIAAEYSVMSVEMVEVLDAADGRSYKASLRLIDGALVESVLIRTKSNLWTTCISCQVGCSVGCNMCATGSMGFLRDLTSEEISDQVLFWHHLADVGRVPSAPTNVVYMGMGEPFLNRVNLFDSLEELISGDCLNVGSRHISVSTCGVVDAFDEFATRFPQVNLSISLHAANDALRDSLVPINRKWSLATLGAAVRDYLERCRRKVFFEYVMLDGVNDGDKELRELESFLKSIGNRRLVHVNLIPYNDTNTGYAPSRESRIKRFIHGLEDGGWHVTRRRSLGDDVNAACGQLAGRGKI